MLQPKFMSDDPRHPRAAYFAKVRLVALKEYQRWFELQQNAALRSAMCALKYVNLELFDTVKQTTETIKATTADEVQRAITTLQNMPSTGRSCTGITGYIEKFDKDGFDIIEDHNEAVRAELCTKWRVCTETFFAQGWSAMDNKLENVLAQLSFLRLNKVVLTDFDSIVRADPAQADLDAISPVNSTYCISCDQCQLCKERRRQAISGMCGGCVILTPWLGYLIGCYMAAYKTRPLPNCALMRGRPEWDHFQRGDEAFLTWRGGSTSAASFADTDVAEQYRRLDQFCIELQEQTEPSSVAYDWFTSESAGRQMTEVLRTAAKVVQQKLHEHVGKSTEEIRQDYANYKAQAAPPPSPNCRKRPADSSQQVVGKKGRSLNVTENLKTA